MHAPKGTMPAYERRAKPSKGNFLSWDAGESKDLVILSKHGIESYTHWVAGESRDCIGEGCSLCAEGLKRTIRWAILVECEGEELPWKMSNTTFFGVEDVAEMVGHLKDLRLRVTRHGTGVKTRYSVLPIAATDTTSDDEIEAQKLAQEIREMCSIGGLDPGQELKLFLSEIAPKLADKPQIMQMRGFFAYIDNKTEDMREPDEPQPEEPEDIGRYF